MFCSYHEKTNMLWVCWKNPKNSLNVLTHKKIQKGSINTEHKCKKYNGWNLHLHSSRFTKLITLSESCAKLCTRLHNYICLLYKNDFDAWHQSKPSDPGSASTKIFARVTQKQLMNLCLVLSILIFPSFFIYSSVLLSIHTYTT